MYKNCSECQKQFLYTTCSPKVWAWNFHLLNCNLMNNLSSYCGLADATKIYLYVEYKLSFFSLFTDKSFTKFMRCFLNDLTHYQPYAYCNLCVHWHPLSVSLNLRAWLVSYRQIYQIYKKNKLEKYFDL